MEESEAHPVAQPGLPSDRQKSVRDRTPVILWLSLEVLLAGKHA